MNKQINIRTDKFTKQEIKVIEDSLKEWNQENIVEIVYVAEANKDNVDVTFILAEENLGEFLWVIFGCGHEFAYSR
ncbi:MAG: hypothetical protein HYZ42_06300 [Bacteroidetes bacterium]|nr:hypothetical protein [Bacteroidota bacterium]